MKLRRLKWGVYVCESDDRLHFYRQQTPPPHGPFLGGLWEFHLKHSRRRHFFATLAEATDFARPLWRPRFIASALDRLHGDGPRLWRDAAEGDRQAFLVLLDWIDDNLPSCRGDFADRDRVLKQADR